MELGVAQERSGYGVLESRSSYGTARGLSRGRFVSESYATTGSRTLPAESGKLMSAMIPEVSLEALVPLGQLWNGSPSRSRRKGDHSRITV
jgi:hypothetical protein